MSRYQYSPLESDSSIRLIRFGPSLTVEGDPLSIQLIETHLYDNDGFEALSYTWGNMSDKVPIKVGNQILMITPNLNNFLKRLHEDEFEKDHAAAYWADQICINQEDIPERNSQVALMASIYRESRRTLVWLGEAGDSETAALDLIRNIDRLGITRNDPLHLALPSIVETIEARFELATDRTEPGLLNLMNRAWPTWFTRAWVIQEVALAVDCTVRVSKDVFRWESMDLTILGLASVTKKAQGTLSGASVLKTMAAAAIRHIQYCRKSWISKKAQTQHDFLQLLGRLSPTMDCTDPRDRVYAYLSLQGEQRNLEADYALTVEDVFIKTSAALAAASKRLDIFAYTRYPPIGPGCETSHVPSWAIDWRMPSTMSGLAGSAGSSFRASGDYEYSPTPPEDCGRVLRVRGNVVDVLDVLSTGHEFPRTGDPFTLMKCLGRHRIFEMALHLYAGQDTLLEAVPEAALYHRAVKVLLCYDRELDDTDGQWDEQLESALGILRVHEANPGRHDYGGGGSAGFESSVALGDALLRRFTSKTNRKSVRAFYATRHRKLLGLSPPLSRPGDLVCVIHGSRTPIILRESSAGRFRVLGQSYLEDWMYGENIWWREDEAKVFELE
ncbi:Heterokaryon incompatibility protein-domain-containing protein [Madurella fahalii]|uniref:Heterokaryon incompatibility protein-domain-containing protein n=1 Tax=Madurella fahalii TaxID=1157608 RepID=A0ABQ0G139_9PEZI